MQTIAPRRLIRPLILASGALTALLAPVSPAIAGKLSWLDEVVQRVVREAEAGGKAAARSEARAARASGRLFAREADESLEALARRSESLARSAGRLDEPAEAVLNARFARVVGADEPGLARTFSQLSPAERRLTVEMGETAQRLARRYGTEAEPMIRRLGLEGMSAVRVYGDEVAEVVAREGPESLGVLRKTGRGGWTFYTEQVLRHKKKLAAAGILAVFLANPEKFVDTAGRVTEYAVDQFARAGIDLAGAVGGGASRGLESAIGRTLDQYGLNSSLLRKAGMVGAGLVVLGATLVLLGLPVGWMLRPVTWPLRRVLALRRAG